MKIDIPKHLGAGDLNPLIAETAIFPSGFTLRAETIEDAKILDCLFVALKRNALKLEWTEDCNPAFAIRFEIVRSGT